MQAMSREGHWKHELEKLKKQIKEYKRMHAAAMEEGGGTAAMANTIKAFEDPTLPGYLQPVEKTDEETLAEKRERRMRKLAEQDELARKSSGAVNEWQTKVKKVQSKIDIKRERRLSYGDSVSSPAHDFNDEDDESSVVVRRRGSPSHSPLIPKEQHGVSRKALIVIIAVEAFIICGLGAAFTWFALTH